MSLFGSLMRDMERDPIFGAHTRAMNRMMGSFFGDGFGGGMDNGLGLMGPNMGAMMPFGGAMSPFGGFPNMMNVNQMMQDPNSHSFSSMSVMSVSSGPDGRPQVYQQSKSTHVAPGGVKETRKTLTDSRTGTKKMAVGRHIGERAHVLEREENMYTGQREENEELINLEEEEAPQFNREWRQRAYNNFPYSHSSSMPQLSVEDGQYRNAQGQLYLNAPPTRDRSHRSRPPSATTSGVTIEELPPSDEEDNQQEQIPTARAALPPIPMVSAPTTSHSRRSPQYVKDRRHKPSKRAKKY